MKPRLFKRLLCTLLVMAMLLSCVPASAAKASEPSPAQRDYPLLRDTLEENMLQLEGYDPDEVVSFILELEGEALLDAKPSDLDASDYLSSAKAETRRIAGEQSNVRARLKTVEHLEITHCYQVVLNGFAVRAPRSAQAELLAIPGVKNVYASVTYEYVEPVNGYTSPVHSSGEMIGSDFANAEGYTGKGTVTAILDTGADPSHEAFQAEPEGAVFTYEAVEALAAEGALQAGSDAASLYKSLKIPFAYDYADGDYDVLGNNNHGIHVAGSVGASCQELTGVAPDTQLVIMKVFSDTQNGAASEWIFAALEDAVLLGVDTINMSLGSASGFSSDALADAVYEKVKNAGINLMVAAGNDYDSTKDTTLGVDLALISEPDNGVIGSPSTYSAAMSVASVNETAIYQTYLLAGDRHIVFTDTNTEDMEFVTALNGQTLEFVWVPGYGVTADFNNVDVRGKIALIPRGGDVAFTTKEQNAYDAGAVAMIVYNNESNADLIGMQLNGLLPAVFISKEDGNYLRGLSDKSISISRDYAEYIVDDTCGYMSDFSSLGVTPDLKLKPEITAPGGNVYSTLFDNTYGVMSGTSMASPHMAGAASVLRQYVNETYPEMSAAEKQSYINTVLMNTAVPVVDEYGVAYSPRKQGAGLAQVYNAIHTGAYVTVDGSERPKADLGDSADGNFSKEISLTVYNTSDGDLRYAVSVLALTAQQSTAVGIDGVTYDVISNYSRVMPESELAVTLSDASITVPAGGSKTVTVQLTLTDAGKAALADFINGTFLDGFVQLTALDEDGIDLSVPYLGFYGDWGQASVFDNTIYEEEVASVYPSAMALFSIYSGQGYYLGTNLFASEGSPLYDVYDADKIAYGSRGDYGRNNWYMLFSLLGLLRAPETLTYTITDASGTEVYQNVVEHERKSFMTSSGYINYAMGPDPSVGWDPIIEEEDGSLYWAADGDYTLTIDAQVAGTETVQTTSFPFSIDNQSPKVTETRYYVVDGTPYIDISVTDNNYVMAMQLISADGSEALAEGEVVGEERKGAITTFTYDLTAIQAAGYKTARVCLYDYALNYAESDLFSVISEFIEADTVSIINQSMTASGTSTPFIIEAMIEPANAKDKTLVWTSSNPEVASVVGLSSTRYDKYADVTYYQALLIPHNCTGDAVITATATNGTYGISTIHVTAAAIDPNDHEHSFSQWVLTQSPTCTEAGVESRFCGCGETETREVAALGHTEVTDAAVAPTCTETGLTEGSYCSVCGEILATQEVVAALGHDWSDWEVVTKVTCQADGEQKHSCTRCDAEETEVIAKYDCPSAAYTDVVADAWYHDAVDYMVMNGLMNGMSPTSFAPEGTLTRAQLVTVLYRIAGEPEVEDTASFEDVEAGLWYTDAIAWAKANGVVNGTSETTFSPDEAITREQIAAILYRYTKSEPVEEDFLKDFPDAASVSSYALDAMNWAVSVGLIGGSDGELLPLSNATRAQIATILMRWLEGRG